MKLLNTGKKTLMAAVLCISTPVAFAGGIEGLAVELKSGTLGGGVVLNYEISPKFTVGVGFNRFAVGMSQSADDIDYDLDLKLQTIPVLGNFHPFEGVFRITGGFMINNNELSGTAKPNATYEIGGINYSADDVGTLNSTISFRTMAPYLGIGWGKSAGSGFGFTFDVGVLFQGSPEVNMSAEGILASDPTFIADLKEEEASAESDINAFNMYPVVSLGLNYRF